MKRYSPDELALLFKRMFETEDGKDVLHVLEEKFSKPSMIPHQVTDGSAMMHLTFCRIGEDNVIRYIKSLINREIGKDDGRNYTD
jgi:hypothetical protein